MERQSACLKDGKRYFVIGILSLKEIVFWRKGLKRRNKSSIMWATCLRRIILQKCEREQLRQKF